MPWVIDRCVGKVFYPLGQTRSAGSNTRLWGINRRLELHHSTTRAHDLRGPLKYGRYGTETASTVVICDTESVGSQVYCLLLLYTLLLLLYRLSLLMKEESTNKYGFTR